MRSTFEEDIQSVLDEYSIRFKAEELRDFSRPERLAILIRSFRATNLLDGFLIFIVVSLLIDTNFEINIVNLIAAAAMGYSAWRFKNYTAATKKLKRLYSNA